MWESLKVQLEMLGGLTLIKWLGLLSMPLFVLSILASLGMVASMDADHFQNSRKPHMFADWPRPLYWSSLVLKNLLGLVLLLAGIVMLLLPGQGLLTILLAVYLLDFPYKHRIEASILSKSQVRQSLNWLRAKMGKRPFVFKDTFGPKRG